MLHKSVLEGVTIASENPWLFESYTDAKRAFCRLRGKPVTPEQALEIIRRTEYSFGKIVEISEHPDFIDAGNLHMNYFSKNFCM